MRLQTVFISNYKNLNNFSLNFNDNSFIDIFVGKNGTGKSNLFEALIEIFRHLYENNYTISFEYKIHFEIDGVLNKIEWNGTKFKLGERFQKTIGKIKLPENILIYYSGHNSKVSELVLAYEESFKKSIKKANIKNTRKFIGIGKEYKQLLLSILLLQKIGNKARQFICSKLGIKIVAPEIKMVLKRPFYADNNYIIDLGDVSTHFWGAEGITKTFLDRLRTCNIDGPARTEGYLPQNDQYVFYLDISKIQKEFKDFSSQELFRQIDNLKTIEMLQDISIPIILNDGSEATTSHFSDGQFQSVYIFSIIELFKDRNCITLLDEPDSFLHPEWQFEFLKQVFEITETASKNNHVLMSSHSASTITLLEENYFNLFEIKSNIVTTSKVCKRDIIDSLSKGFIKFTEDESKLRIDNAVRSSSKPVLFVEGPTDVYILETAYKKLYGCEELPILVQDAFDRGFIKILMSRLELFNQYPGKTFFALFDFDDAYDDWRDMPGEHKEVNLCNGLCKKLNNRNGFAFLLPIPNNDLKNQVWDEQNPIEKIRPNPCFGIEHIFWGATGTQSYFKELNLNGIKKIVFKGDKFKVKFAKNIVPNLSIEAFESKLNTS